MVAHMNEAALRRRWRPASSITGRARAARFGARATRPARPRASSKCGSTATRTRFSPLLRSAATGASAIPAGAPVSIAGSRPTAPGSRLAFVEAEENRAECRRFGPTGTWLQALILWRPIGRRLRFGAEQRNPGRRVRRVAMFWAPYWRSDLIRARRRTRPSGRRSASCSALARRAAGPISERCTSSMRWASGLRSIVGSSIGSLVGGCYAAGKLDMLEAFARSLTRRRIFGFIDFSFAGGGLIGGERLRARLEAELGGMRIEDLPIRFAGVATEIGGGHEIWLQRGLAGRGDPGVLRAARRVRAGPARGPLDVRRRASSIRCRSASPARSAPSGSSRSTFRARASVAAQRSRIRSVGRSRPRPRRAGQRQRRRHRALVAAGRCAFAERARALAARPHDRDGQRLRHPPGPHHALAPRG